jgi:hypothetical protein
MLVLLLLVVIVIETPGQTADYEHEDDDEGSRCLKECDSSITDSV